jgi:hypothetical protein
MSGAVETRDVSSGRVHARYATGQGELEGLEGCNLDSAGAYEVLTPEAFAEIRAELPESICDNCHRDDQVGAGGSGSAEPSAT